jgi:CRP-like cAMP-binding protein
VGVPKEPDVLDAIRGTEVFEGIARADLEPLLPALRRRTYPKGSHLFYAGDPPTAAWAIVSGLVKTCHLTPNGDELVVGIHWHSCLAGEYWLLDEGGSRLFDAIAAERTETVVIGRQALQHV